MEEGRKNVEDFDPYEDIRCYDFPEGFGSAFVLFNSVPETKEARSHIHLLKYNEKQLIESVYW